MNDPAVLDTIAGYLPALIVRRLVADPSPIPLPTSEEHPAAVLFADISGFTALTERLALQGPSGTEQLTQLLNTYFGRLIEIITAHGGDVVKFAGDALLAVWQEDVAALERRAHSAERIAQSGERGTQSAEREEDTTSRSALCALALCALALARLTQRAAQCALAVQGELHGYQAVEGVRLALRVAVGAGPVRHLHLGGVFGRCEFLTVGQPFADVGTANKQVRPEDAVVTPGAWLLIADRCQGDVLPSGDVRLLGVSGHLPLCPLDRPRLTAEAEPVAVTYLPAAVRARLEAGQTDWVGEMRQMTVLFVNLPDLNYRTAPEVAQLAMSELQQALYRFEGSVNKLSVDDKGVTLVAALGLPPLAHEDDPIRGVQAAMAILTRLKSLGWTGSVGVATGRAFCGAYGSPTRREYTMIGKVVNLSARLMQAAHGDIYCDEATWHAAQARIRFETLAPILVKGRVEAVPIFRPLGLAQRMAVSSGKPLIGRRTERQALFDRLRALRDRGAGGVVVIEGDAGIGKSRLLWEVLRQTREEGLALLSGAADAIDRSTPYFAWRPVFRQLFGLEGSAQNQEVWRQQVLAQLAGDAELSRLAPLLSAVLPGDWPANEVTAEMTGEVRADNTNRLLLRLLERVAGSRLVLTLDDCQWLDSASWMLARLAVRDLPSLLLVLATRPLSTSGSPFGSRVALPVGLPRLTQQAPLTDTLPALYSQLLYAPTTCWVRLDVLSEEDTVALVCQRLGVRSLPRLVIDLIYERTQGNPYFSEELAYALRDARVIEVEAGECRLAPGARDLEDVALPDNIQGVVTSRIDRLRPPEQLSLKVASVIGRVFSLSILRDLYPIEDDRAALLSHLETLRRRDLTRQEGPELDGAYSFKHSITREVVYNLMLVAQRQDLHRAAAEWYERNRAQDLAPLYALLAHHWSEAQVGDKAIDYLARAGEQSLNSHANDEAIAFFSEALARVEREERGAPGAEREVGATRSAPGAPRSTLRRACWERQLGEAHYAQGDLPPAQVHLERAVALLGFAVPPAGWRRLAGSVWQLLRQLLHRVGASLFTARRPSAARREVLLEAARSYECLARVHYLNNARIPCLHAALCTLNLTEAAGLSSELARSYANASVVFGLLGLHGSARAHARRAVETARAVNQLSCTTYVLEVTGMYWYSVANWAQASAALGQAAELAESLGDVRRWDETLVPLAMVPYHHGDFRASAAIPLQLLASAQRRGIPQVQCWALSWRIVSLLPQGLKDPDVAAQAAEAILALDAVLAGNASGSGKLVRADQVFGYGVLAQAHWRRGEVALALKAAEKGITVSAECEPISHYVLAGYIGLLEVHSSLWEASLRGQPPAGAALTAEHCEKLCRSLDRSLWDFTRMHPVGQPQAWLWHGLHLWLGGKKRRAYRAWKKGLAAAKRLGMPHDQALIHFEMGRHANLGDPARGRHLTRARETFAHLGAAHDLERVESEMKNGQ